MENNCRDDDGCLPESTARQLLLSKLTLGAAFPSIAMRS
jgi:hypothetical protein